ncbi:MAG: alpha/beta fold hydrolase [Gemmatimonadales bacterium]
MKLPVGRFLLTGYLVTLGASTVWRATHRPVVAPAPDETAVTVSLAGGPPVTIANRDLGPRNGSSLPVVLIHGSPGDNGEVRGLGRMLADSQTIVTRPVTGAGAAAGPDASASVTSPPYRAIAPDLPGFGGSTRRVPDYSVAAHAEYVLALLDSLGIRRAHLVGFSMGGGVVLELAGRAPDRVASLTLLSALGAQEYELLGDYYLNHAIHWLQLGAIWGLENLVPHFGYLDGGFLTVEYARNFYDTDQRPLRKVLSTFAGPALVIQGDKDFLVDPAVARESHRLLPQSEMAMFGDPDASHFMTFQRPDTIAAVLRGFLARVEAGTAVTRATASPERLAEAARPFDPKSIPAPVGVALVVLLALLAAATLVSEDLACITAGLLVTRGTVGFVPGTIACLVGIVGGDLWLYGMGRWLGRPALRRAPLKWFVSEAAVERSAAWFQQQGLKLVLLTRFVPGTRLPTYFTAGVLRAGAVRFLVAFCIAALLWTPLLVGASALFGEQILARFVAYQAFALPGLILVALFVLLVFKLVFPLGSWRGRRLLLSRWRRLTRWEFWPRWAFYPPIVAYIVWLAIKHRSLTLFTAVNPAIPGGGFVGESKAGILRGLAHAPDQVARWTLIDEPTPEERLGQLRRFLADQGLTYPVVLKPDVGERGGGVRIVRDEADALLYLERSREPILAQEFVGGIECGIFYYRLPGEARGKIFAVTDKHFPAVVGDGRSTLEHLILADERAVCMAPTFLARFTARLDEVPAAGLEIPLIELGTHSLGAEFRDGASLASPALETAIDTLSRGYEGFWFGRYDVKAPSREILRAGREFKVLELNGATAEATSIYDPKNGILTAYRILRRQWALLFEIARRNAAAGARPATVRELLQLIDRHRRSLGAHVAT